MSPQGPTDVVAAASPQRALSLPLPALLPAFAVAMILATVLAGPLVTDSLYQVDSGELNAVLAEPGVAHPTGYPTYTILGHFFGATLRALLSPQRAHWPLCGNSFSFLWYLVAAGATALIFVILARPSNPALPRSPAALLALMAGFFLWAGHPGVLVLAASTEVYMMNLGLIALAWLVLAFGLATSLSPLGLRVWVFALGAIGGVGLTHHLTFALMGVPLFLGVVAVAAHHRVGLRRFGGMVARGALGTSLGLLPLLYLPLRARQEPEMNWGRTADSLEHFLYHIRGAQYYYRVGQESLGVYLAGVYGEMHAIERAYLGIGLAAWAALVLRVAWEALRRRRAEIAPPPATDSILLVRALLLLHAALAMGMNLLYQIPDISDYFPPIWWDIGMAGSLTVLGAISAPAGARRLSKMLLVAVAPLALLALLGHAEAKAVLARARDGVALVRDAWEALPDEPSVVIFQNDNVGLMRFWHYIEGEKPNVVPGHLQHFIGNGPDFRRRIGGFGMYPVLLYDEGVYSNAAEVARWKQNLVATFLENVRERATVPVYEMDRATCELKRLDGGASRDFVDDWAAAGLVPPDAELLKRHATEAHFKELRATRRSQDE